MRKKPDYFNSSDKHFQAYLEFTRLGLRGKAKVAITALIAALPSLGDKKNWTREHLEQLPRNGKGQIQHNIYSRIVFPALQAGIEQGEPKAFYLLATTWQNVCSTGEAADIVKSWSQIELYKRAIDGEPDCSRYKMSLLDLLIKNFDFLDHEWPSGILVDHRYASAELDQIKEEIDLARLLDVEGHHTGRLDIFSTRIDIYLEHIKSSTIGP